MIGGTRAKSGVKGDTSPKLDGLDPLKKAPDGMFGVCVD